MEAERPPSSTPLRSTSRKLRLQRRQGKCLVLIITLQTITDQCSKDHYYCLLPYTETGAQKPSDWPEVPVGFRGGGAMSDPKLLTPKDCAAESEFGAESGRGQGGQ